MDTLTFPGLGLSFTLNRVAFTVFGQEIYWYGILFGVAFIVAVLFIIRRVHEFGLDADRMIDVLLGTVIGGIVGARLYYVIFSGDTYTFAQIFNIREGGLALYGGIIGAMLAMALMCKLRKVKFAPICDLFASSLLLAQAIGRWGNFVNIEAFGSNTTLPWGMTSPMIVRYLTAYQEQLASIGVQIDPAQPVHPTFFYESLWCLVGFILITRYIKLRKFDGEITLMYLFWYGLGRAWIEGLRTDSLLIGPVRVSQLLAILCVAASVILWINVRRRVDASTEHALYVNTEEGQAILAGTFYNQEQQISADGEATPEEDTRQLDVEQEEAVGVSDESSLLQEELSEGEQEDTDEGEPKDTDEGESKDTAEDKQEDTDA